MFFRNRREINFEQNSFDILKYWAAFSVMFLHYTYYAFMEAKQAWGFMDRLRYISEYFPGIIVLFTISGFLIYDSMERSESKQEFLKKRVFRLYPELWLCTIVNLLVLLVIAREYLDGSILVWTGAQVFGIAYTPSCLDGFATGSVNGALWTIFVEVQLYLIICFGYQFLKKLKKWQWGLFLLVFAGLNLLCAFISSICGGIVSKLIERSCVPYAIWFMIGVFCYQYKEKVIQWLKYLLLPMLIVYSFVRPHGMEHMGYYIGIGISILCPFIVIGAAYLLPPMRFKVDLSYGMFLYHWIILNIIVHFELLQEWKWYICLGFFSVSTLLLAWISKRLTREIMRGFKRKKKGKI